MKIKLLTIYTSQLKEQKQFYTQILQFPLVEASDSHFVVEVGKSRLQFLFQHDATPYHFAINIPSNKSEEAHGWLKKRLTILDNLGSEIVDFENWNAKAIYFYDPDKNIVEFIARQNLAVLSDRPFSQSSVLAISEIGIPVSDIEKTYHELKRLSGFEIYDGSFERFCAVGDEDGLFIVINKEVKNWFPADDPAYSSDFEIKLESHGQELEFRFLDGRLSFS